MEISPCYYGVPTFLNFSMHHRIVCNRKEKEKENNNECLTPKGTNRQPKNQIPCLYACLVEVVKGNCYSNKQTHTKNNNDHTYIYTRSLWGIQTGCLGGPAWGTEPEQLSVVVV